MLVPRYERYFFYFIFSIFKLISLEYYLASYHYVYIYIYTYIFPCDTMVIILSMYFAYEDTQLQTWTWKSKCITIFNWYKTCNRRWKLNSHNTKLDIHNKTRVIRAILWYETSAKRRIENKTSLDLVMLIGSAGLLIFYLYTHVPPIELCSLLRVE